MPRFRFKLRHLLLGMAMLSIWLAIQVKGARDQRLAVRAIRDVSSIRYDYQFDESGKFNADAEPPAPRWLRERIGDDYFVHPLWLDFGMSDVTDSQLNACEPLDKLESLHLSNARKLTDDGLRHLSRMKELRVLTLDGTTISDQGLSHLPPLRNLEHLALDSTLVTSEGFSRLVLSSLRILTMVNTPVDDACFAAFSNMAQLEVLALGGTKVEGRRIADLVTCSNLRTLDLRSTAVSDDAVPALGRLGSLTRLYLQGSQITESGVKRLQELLPDCRITR